MEYLNEGIALGVDLLILGICFKEYHSYKSTIKSLKVRDCNLHLNQFKYYKIKIY